MHGVDATEAVTVVAAQVPHERSADMRSKMRRGEEQRKCHCSEEGCL